MDKSSIDSQRETVPPVAEIACSRCGALDLPRVLSGVGPHAFQARCQHCGTFLRWVSKYTPEERAQRRQSAQPLTEQQLEYLVSLRDPNPPPTTLDEATARITALLQAQRGQR